MLELFDLGEHFLESLQGVGDFLLNESYALPSWLLDYLEMLQNGPGSKLGSMAASLVLAFNGHSIAYTIFGTAIIGILLWRLIKFIIPLLN